MTTDRSQPATAPADAGEDGLAPCRSAPHRAVAGLLRAAAGGGTRSGLTADLAAASFAALDPIINASGLMPSLAGAVDRHPELKDALPVGLAETLRRDYLANVLRTERIRAELKRLGGLFRGAGMRAVVLKGGAELLAPAYADSAQRWTSDIDLLVDADGIVAAIDLLVGAGAVADAGGLDETHKHAAPLVMPGSGIAVEIHRRLGNGIENDLVPADVVLETARQHDCGLAIPRDVDRLVHMIAHAQISNLRHAVGAVELRDVLDHAWMRRTFGEDIHAEAAERFSACGAGAEFEGLAALSEAVVPRGRLTFRRGRRWAARALRRFGRPGMRRIAEPLIWARIHATRFLSNRDHRRRYLAIIGRSGLFAHLRRSAGLRRTRIR